MKPRDQTIYRKALDLRFKGKSYGEIKQLLKIPKSTQSGWFKNLKLPPSAQKILKEKDRIGRKKLIEFNQQRTQIIQAENQKIRENAFKEINLFSSYELMMIGATLYWAEGWNRDTKGKGHEVCFVNSNPDMIKLFLRFLREIIHVSENKLRVNIHIHPNIDEKSTINFWSRVTNIPKERFHITQQISRASKGKRPKNSLPYGTLKLDVSKRQNFFRIKGWIDGLKYQSNSK